ncbi:MAG: ribonuclease III [Synechococcales cyanobacterium CRU_2_2]|nr:ribonuclease III [Synechococcales cyanobacterium CRU_2_2]
MIDPRRQKQLESLVQKLALAESQQINWALLNLALTHPTASQTANYEHLEFVGDAVVRLASAEFLTTTYADSSVGELAALRSVLVSDRVLSQIATRYALERYLLMSSSAAGDRAGATSRQADALEAVMGALFLSTQDLSYVSPWLNPHLHLLSEEIRQDPARQNYKAALQEWSQGEFKELPEYKVEETSTIHGDRERFTAEVWLRGQCLGRGKGRSIKTAQQAAAEIAFRLVCPQRPEAQTVAQRVEPYPPAPTSDASL